MPSKTGARFNLGKALAADLTDFCEANLGTTEIEIIRRALRAFVDSHLANDPKMKERFDAARRKRLGALEAGNVTVLPTAQSPK